VNKIKPLIIIAVLVIIAFWFINNDGGENDKNLTKSNSHVLSNFEDPKIWDTSPERGFKINLSKNHVTEGSYSFEIVYPKGGMPSINTKRLSRQWGEYEHLGLDVFNPQDETVKFRIRLDDTNGKKADIFRNIVHGMNNIQIPRSEIAVKINAGQIRDVVLYLFEPDKSYTLYFDNLRILTEASKNSAGDKSFKYEVPKRRAEKTKIYKNIYDAPKRKAVPLPEKIAPKSGEIRVAVSKMKVDDVAVSFISSGIPFAPGQLTSELDFVVIDQNNNEIPIATKVLAKWPMDQSIRSVLVQFKYPIQHLYEYVTFKWGEKRKTKYLQIIEPDWDYPEAMMIMPAQWLCDSQVIGEQVPMGKTASGKYDFNIMKFFPEISNKPWTGNLRSHGYYSTAHVFYQFFVRTGELKYFLAARKELIHYRETQIIKEGKNRGKSKTGAEGRYVYVQAMADDYLLTGDKRSLEVAGYMAEYLKNYIKPSKAFYPKSATNFWTERFVSFPFLGILTYYELTQNQEYRKLADQYMENLYRMQLQWPNRGGFIHNLYAHDPEEGAGRNEYGGSPFMTGLLMEPIIKYHKLTGSEVAADSIFRAVDWIIKEGLTSSGTSFKYLTSSNFASSGGEPDVNLLVVHALGYAYRLSGYKQDEYLKVAQNVFFRGIEDGFLGHSKHFNQNYRNSGHYLAYIKNGIAYHAKKTNGAKKTLPTLNRRQILLEKNILFFEDFDGTTGRFTSTGDASLSIDGSQTYLNGKSLKIRSKFISSNFTAGVNMSEWFIEDFPTLTFAYLIPEGTPVGLRVLTQFGDWICLGGSQTYQCDHATAKKTISFIDDGRWHEIHVNVTETVRSVLPAIKNLDAIQFYTGGNSNPSHYFWIDDFKIKK